MPLSNQTHPFLETYKRKTQIIAGPLCSPLSILVAHPSTICTIAVLQRNFLATFCQSVWALFSSFWRRGQKPGNIPPWPWLTPNVRASQDNVRKSVPRPPTAKSPITTFYSFHADVCSWRPAELVSVVRGPLVYSWTRCACPVDSRGHTGEADGCGVSVPRGESGSGRCKCCFAGDGNDGKAQREAGALASHEQGKTPCNLPSSSCCFESVDQTQTRAAAGEKRKEESLCHSPFPFLLRFPSSFTGIGRNVATSCPWIVPAL